MSASGFTAFKGAADPRKRDSFSIVSPHLKEHSVASTSYREVWPHIVKTLKSADPRQHVVVFDIDATVLYNTDDNECGAVPNFKVQPIYDYAEKKGVPIYFVTARIGTPGNREATQRQLRCMGFFTYEDLYMRGADVRTASQVAAFKAQSRRDIEQRTGKKVLLNVGDQWSDVVVGSASTYDSLEEQFPGQHVLFMPPRDAGLYGMVQVKLFELEH